MLHLRRILHPTDFSPSAEAALPHALFLARRYGAALHLLHVAPPLGEDPLRGALTAADDEKVFYRHQRDVVDARMKALIASWKADDVPIRRVVTNGRPPGAVVLEYAESERIQLVVMGTHGRRGLRRLLMGSVAQEVVRRSRCPVLTARMVEDEEGSRPPGWLERVLVPLDFSGYDLDVLAHARELAALYRAELALLHVVDPSVHMELFRAALPDRGRLEDEYCSAARERLRAVYSAAPGPHVQATFHTRVGYAPNEIIAHAEQERADLVIMASHGLGSLGEQGGRVRLALGSTAERVVRSAPLSVLVLKPYGLSLLAKEWEAPRQRRNRLEGEDAALLEG